MRERRSLKAIPIIAILLGLFLSFSPAITSAGDDPLARIIAGIGSNKTTLEISNQQSITADLTIPSNVALKFTQGGSLTSSNSSKVTFNGLLEAGLNHVFEGNLVVEFGAGSVKEVYPQWWGAKMDDATESSAAFQAAIDSFGGNGGKVFISSGTMLTESRVNYKEAIRIEGQGIASIIHYTGNDYAFLMGSGGTPGYSHLGISNLEILGSAFGLGGIKLHWAAKFLIDNVKIQGFSNGAGIYFHDYVAIGNVNNSLMKLNKYGIHALLGTVTTYNAILVTGGELQGNTYGALLGDPTDAGCATSVGMGSQFIGVTIENNFSGGIWNAEADALAIIGCYFEDNNKGGGAGVDAFNVRIGSEDGNTYSPRGCSIENCHIDSSMGTDYISIDLLRAKWCNVTRNYLHAGLTAFNVGANSVDNNIEGNFYFWTLYTNELIDAGSGTRYRKLLDGQDRLIVDAIALTKAGGFNYARLDTAQLWTDDINGAAGKAGFYIATENSGALILPGILIKADTGDPAYFFDGMICINTFDNNIKIYADAGWRTLTTW